MRIILMIMADIFIAAIAVMATNEYYGAARHASFTVPFTEKMVSLGVIDPEKGRSIIAEDKYIHYVGILIAAVTAGMMAKFIAGISGVIVFAVVAAALIIFIHPDMTETTATRSAFYRTHHTAMDVRRYHDYLVSVGDVSDSDPTA